MTGNEPGMSYRLAAACGIGTCYLDFQACTVGAESPTPPEAVYESRKIPAYVLSEVPDFLVKAVRRIEDAMGSARPAQVFLRTRWMLEGGEEKGRFLAWLEEISDDLDEDLRCQAESVGKELTSAARLEPFELSDPDFRTLRYLAERRAKRRGTVE